MVPVASAPGGRRPSSCCTTVFGTFQTAPFKVVPLTTPAVLRAIPDCERIVAAISTSTFGIVYAAEPRSVVRNGSTLRQFRGSGLSIKTVVAQLSVTARPVLVPT